VSTVQRALSEFDLPADLLEIEVTEAVAMGSVSAGQQALDRVRDLGVRVALDDFGTGYSSLSSLAKLPIDLRVGKSSVSR
jgi:EAL domain-containing protein (putative c-di-GMP-specific phosphodiesterase class I)